MTNKIEVANLGKEFRHVDPNRPTTLVEMITQGWRRLRPKDRFWALRDVNFTVESGRMLGIIGHNGAGKSTLLRLLGEVGKPDLGSVKVNGRIGALLDLGTGFHPELSGRENIFVAGVIGGLTRKEVVERFDDIVAFAEMETFIENPLRTYSSGMQMRLAFAVAIHIEPEILLIDEVLAVGDIAFQKKCLSRIAEFREQGCTIVLVSHDATLVQELCDDALWLRKGEVAAYGPAALVVDQYIAEVSSDLPLIEPAPPPLPAQVDVDLQIDENRFGTQKMGITAVCFTDAYGNPITEIETGHSLHVQIEYHAPVPIQSPIFGITISTGEGVICHDTSTDATGLTLPTLHGQGAISLHLQRLDLIGGEYVIDVGVFEQTWAYAYDYHWQAYPLTIRGNWSEKGILAPPQRWELHQQMPT